MCSDFAELASRVLRGDGVDEAIERLASGGVPAVRAVLDRRGSLPPRRDRRDSEDDLGAALWAIARRDPDALVEVLREGDDDDTLRLVRALGASQADVAVDALLELLAHRDQGVRASTAHALRTIGTPRAVAPLAARLRDRSANVRWEGLKWIDEYLPDRTELAVREYLAREDLPPGAVRIATGALARYEARATAQPGRGQRAALDPAMMVLVQTLIDGTDDLDIQDQLVEGGAAGARALREGFGLPLPPDRRPQDVRQELGDTLQLLAMDDLPSLLKVLHEGGDGAAHLAEALYSHSEDASVQALVALLASPSPHDRWSAVWSLSKAGTPGAVEPLLQRLGDPSLPVRVAAVVAVAVHCPAGADDALRELLQRSDLVPAEVQAARAALSKAADSAESRPTKPPRRPR